MKKNTTLVIGNIERLDK